MPRISLSRQNSIPDVISTDNYELVLGNFPGAVNPDTMTLKCLNASYPGMSNETYEVNINSHVLKFRGRKMMPRTLAVTYVEDAKFDTTNSLLNWHEYIVGSESATSGGNKAQYAIDSDLIIYDGKGGEINRVTFRYLFPQDIPDTQLSGESTTPWNVTATFNYDTYDTTGVTRR